MGAEDCLVEYKEFKEKMKGFRLVPVVNVVGRTFEVKPYQLRILSCNVPRYWFIVMEDDSGVSGLYRVLVFTEDVGLANFKSDGAPVLRIDRKYELVCLPFWIYLTEEFLREYTAHIIDVTKSEAERMLLWVMWNGCRKEDSVRWRYVRDVMDLMSDWSFSSLLDRMRKGGCSSKQLDS
ncbi:MAG: hypothetical protein JHC26_11665 [Thermofilum sp.]|uniref:hypothetical protein n=1 Tax=Thermofilum sp. TaxID=1961369 RepID=UPI00258A98C2|nr:hypothetical protein [Thermofilum sp.]MCI4409740.1 hypothetical protein [Thermofilum sp.]